MRALLLVPFVWCVAASATSSTEGPSTAATKVTSSLLRANHLSAIMDEDPSGTATRETIVPLHLEKRRRNRRKESALRPTNNGGMSSPTGSDNLLLDFIRHSSYLNVIRSDAAMVSNTTAPTISVNFTRAGEEAHTADVVVVDVPVPHIVQVWAVQVPPSTAVAGDSSSVADGIQSPQFLAADAKSFSYTSSEGMRTTHYFVIEHTATGSDRKALADGYIAQTTDAAAATDDNGDRLANPFTIHGKTYKAAAAEEETPAWLNAFNKFRSGPVGMTLRYVSMHLQEQLLLAEERVKVWLYGESHHAHKKKPSTADISSDATKRAEARTLLMEQRAQHCAAIANNFIVSGGTLDAMDPIDATTGSFVVGLELSTAADSNAVVPVQLRGNYSFTTAGSFIPNPALHKLGTLNPLNYFDYSLTFVSSDIIEQQHALMNSNGKKATYSVPSLPRCTHYRAVAQYDKRHIAVTTMWEVDAGSGVGSTGVNGADNMCRWERTIVLHQHEVAGVDVRFLGDAAPELDEDEQLRFRFMDVGGAAADAAGTTPTDDTDRDTVTDTARRASVATIAVKKGGDTKPLFVNPQVRRVALPSYYHSREAGSGSGRRRSFTSFLPLPSFSSRARRLLPTVALLVIVTLVKFGPKVYLNWLDAKQQKRKGALSMKEAMQATIGDDAMRKRLSAASNKKSTAATSNTSGSSAAAATATTTQEGGSLTSGSSKRYGSGQALAKAEAALRANNTVKDPQWRQRYEEALERRKKMTPQERADLEQQQKELLQQMMREDGLLEEDGSIL